MKKLITLLLVLVTLNGYGQVVIDNEKIEKLCFEIHNTYRDSSYQRILHEGCKKAADFQVDYMYKMNKATHQNATYGYYEPEDRFEKFNPETEKRIDIYGRPWEKKLYIYNGEVAHCTWNYSFKVDSLLEEKIARHIMNKFVNSPGHFFALKRSMVKGNIYYGYFSVRTLKLSYDPKENRVYLNIYCVGVFGFTMT